MEGNDPRRDPDFRAARARFDAALYAWRKVCVSDPHEPTWHLTLDAEKISHTEIAARAAAYLEARATYFSARARFFGPYQERTT